MNDIGIEIIKNEKNRFKVELCDHYAFPLNFMSVAKNSIEDNAALLPLQILQMNSIHTLPACMLSIFLP